MVKPIKVEKVEHIKERFSNASSMVLTDYRGLDVSEISQLRRNLEDEGIDYKVVKNTLAQIAAKEIGMEDLLSLLEGPTAIAFGSVDPIAPARLIHKFTKEHEALEVKGGFMDGLALTAEQVIVLANLPSREQLLSMFAGAMQATMAGMARVLNAPLQGFAIALKALADKNNQ